MTTNWIPEKLRLRPHHIFCERFSPWKLSERGEMFNRVESKIKETLRSGLDTLIEVIEGTDELCKVCPLFQNERCQSPRGDEDEVRKLDAIILKGMGISYGDKMTAKRFRALIDEKAPLAFCQTRCKLSEVCSCGSLSQTPPQDLPGNAIRQP